MSANMQEVFDEFCTSARNELDGPSFDYLSDFRTLCGYPNSSEDTIELVSLLQTEQALLHHQLSASPGNPSQGQLTYINRLKTTSDLLSDLHKSSSVAGFPSRGYGYRKAFATLAKLEIDRIATTIAASSVGVPERVQRPPGLPALHGPTALGAIRPAVQAQTNSAPSTTAQASPYTKHYNIASPLTDQAILASSSSSNSSSSVTASSESLSIASKQRKLEEKLKAMRAAGGVGSLLSSLTSKKSSSSSSSAHTALSLANSGAPEALAERIETAKRTAHIARLKLEQVQADAEVAALLQHQLDLEASTLAAKPSIPAHGTRSFELLAAKPSVPAPGTRSFELRKTSSDSDAGLVTDKFLEVHKTPCGSPQEQNQTLEVHKTPCGYPQKQNQTYEVHKTPCGYPQKQKQTLEVHKTPCGSPRKNPENPSGKFYAPPSRTSSPQASQRKEPQSPSPNETTAQALRAQLAEVEAMIQAEKQIEQSSPEDQLKNQLSTLRLELEMLKKTALNPAIVPSAVTIAKESDKVAVAGTPTPANYKTWRDGVEVSVVSASGRANEAVAFMSDILTKSPSELVRECPPEMKGLDVKYACGLRASLSTAGLSGERVLLLVQADEELKFSGRAIQKLTDVEFGYLSLNSIAVASAAYQRLRLAGSSWSALEAFLNTLDSLLLKLKNTPEYPSNVSLMTMLEDQVETQQPTTSAAFAAFRQREIDGETPQATDLIKMLKARCLKHREKSLRDQVSKAAVATTDSKQKPATDKASTAAKAAAKKQSDATLAAPATSSNKKEPCQLFQIGKCKHMKEPDKCKYAHKNDRDAKKKAEARDKEYNAKLKAQPSSSGGNKPQQAKLSIPCKFFAAGTCQDKNCRFLHTASASPAGSPTPTGVALALPAVVAQLADQPSSDRSCLSASSADMPMKIQPNFALPVFGPEGHSLAATSARVLDSGAGVHLVSPSDCIGLEIQQSEPLNLETANGIVQSRDVVTQSVSLGSGECIEVESRVLANTPSVLALGRLCMLQGFGFSWPPGQLPILTSPAGIAYEIPLTHFVPTLDAVRQLPPEEAALRIQALIENIQPSSIRAVPATQCNPTLLEQFHMFRNTLLPSHRLLFEICCESDSSLGTVGLTRGYFVIRVTQSHDFFSGETLDHMIQFASQEQSCHSHSSVPCTPWSRFQNLNIARAADQRGYLQRLRRQRAASLKLIKHVRAFTAYICGSKSFEWPLSAHDGWSHADVLTMLEETKMIYDAVVSACATGSIHPDGTPFGKKFLFKCSSPHLASSLSELACRGDHEHAVTQGSFTAPSANYTPKLAQHYFTGLDRHNTATLAMPAAASAIAGVAPVLDVPDDGELTISRNDALKAIATSTNHLLTHYPKNPFCEHCNLAKQRRFGHRARKAPLERSEAFGDRVLLDTIIATRSAPGFDGSTICHALQDDCTAICAAYPRDSRDGDTLQVCLRSFLGGAIAASNTVCSDQAGEIISACSSLGINHLATTPHDSESHGRQEAFNQRLINVTRVALVTAGLPPEFWPLATEHAAFALNITPRDDEATTPYENKHGHIFSGHKVPFGAAVSYVPPAGEKSKFDSSGTPCIFVGWRTSPGCKFQDYVVMPMHHFIDKTYRTVITKDIVLPPEWKFPSRELAAQALALGYAKSRPEELKLSAIFEGESDEENPIPPAAVQRDTASSNRPGSSSDPPPPQPQPQPASIPSAQKLTGPVGRPAASRPPHWGSTEELKRQWTNFSQSKRNKLTAEYQQQLAAESLSRALVTLLTGRFAPEPTAHALACEPTLPTASDAPLPFGPVAIDPLPNVVEEHRPKEPANPEAGNYWTMFSLIIKQITKSDPGWNSVSGQKAIFDELSNLRNEGVFHLTPREYDDLAKHAREHPDEEAHFTHLHGLLGIKNFEMTPDHHKWKARFVLVGNRIFVVDGSSAQFAETSNCPTNLATIRGVTVFSSVISDSEEDDASQADAVGAYIQHILRKQDGPPTWVIFENRDISDVLLAVFPELKGMRRPCLLLRKPLYGHPKAGLLWEQFLSRTLKSIGWEDAKPFPQLFVKEHGPDEFKVAPRPRRALAAYVDDLHLAGKNQDREWALIRSLIKTTDPTKVKRTLGVNFTITRPRPGIVSIRQEMIGYTRSCLAKYAAAKTPKLRGVDTPAIEYTSEVLNGPSASAPGSLQKECASHVMSLMFLARMLRSDILVAVNRCSQYLSKWSELADGMLHRIMCYLEQTQDATLVYELPCGENIISSIFIDDYCDADYAGCPSTAKSTAGGLHQLNINGQTAALDWLCKKQTSVAHSTTESEVTSADKVIRDLTIPAQMLWQHLLNRPIASRLHEDNESAIKIIRSGYSTALRHIVKTQRVSIASLHEHFSDPLNTLVYCPTLEQRADFLTKPLDRIKLHSALDMIGLRVNCDKNKAC